MPSNLPSSFASAAAGQNANRDTRGGRSDGRGAVGGEWSRRDGRSTNGSVTFRRSSTTPLGQPPSQPPASLDHAVQTPAAVETPIAQSTGFDLGPIKYTREDLLEIYRGQKPNDDASRLFLSGWNPGHVNGSAPRGWGKSNDNHIPQEPGACWDEGGDTTPMGLHGLSAEEREAFSTEINSPLKPPTQNKEGHQPGTNGRKASLSQGAGNAYGVNSPSSATRPGTRRRETIESNPFSSSALASPTANRFNNRDDPNYWFRGKNTDLKESEADESDNEQNTRDTSSKLPFGNLMRSNTGGVPSMSSIWPPSNQTTPGAGGFGNFAMPTSSAVGGEKRSAAAGGGSRLAHLMTKDSSDSPQGKTVESPNPLNQQSWRSRPRTDTDPFGDDGLSGSAVLGGAQDTGPIGMSQANRAGTLGTPVKGSTGDFGMSGLNLGDDNGPVSPSETNPYRSPPAERRDQDENDPSGSDKPLGNNPHDQASGFGSISRGFGGGPFDGGDRSQTSSVGPKPYPALNTLSGWPAPAPVGTPDRERPNFGTAFGNSLFSPVGELQSPGLSNLTNVFGPTGAGGIGTGSISRGSKLGSLFPPAMQAQMQTHDHDNNLADSLPDLRQSNPLGAIGRGNFGIPTRDTDSPIRSNRGVFEELFPSSDPHRAHNTFSTAEAGHPSTTATAPQSFTPVSGSLPFGGNQAGAEPPAAQVRQMVMPDRMRWVYLDPQGQIQGPFTGLEMNDWYKANFFTPDLRVKKVEDPEFEPLGQLIRRIGNSREPFLVPQIGIPHGPPTQAGPFSSSNASGVIPPLSGVFPSFGRTLTAEEQNNLERRKQEEQYMMVQQREFVMRQQAMSKFQMQGPALQHHSSAHSLQSQPSFGNIASQNPIGMPPQPQQPPIGVMPPTSGFFDGPGGPIGSAPGGNRESLRDEEILNLSPAERQVLASMHGAPGSGAPQPIGAPLTGADIGLRGDLPKTEDLNEDPEGFRERLQEFEDLRAQHDAEQAAKAEESSETEESEDSSPASAPEPVEQPVEPPVLSKAAQRAAKKKATEEAALSLTQQVQKAQAAAIAAAQVTEPGMPMPFPPPPASSTTPLPAPTAQRARSNLPDQYNRSQTGTPDTSTSANVQPPPLAPWAKDLTNEAPKGPSLKEIQEAEARKAAKAEEAAAALRKSLLEQEALALREREKAAASAAGLPATSTWGHGSPAAAASPWVKPGLAKAPVSGTSSAASGKKTLAEIQREEELRKQKAQATSIQSGAPVNVSKSYANLAGKPGSGAPSPATAAAVPVGSGWATVGAGGKVKIPTGPSSQGRSVSAAAIKPVTSPVKPVAKPVAAGSKNDGNAAMEEFNKWVHRELSRGITGVNDIANFQATLDVLPLETTIIADAVYSSSTTMDGRHFAEEFIRRKKLADRGIVERQPTDTKAGASSSGWNEVAKKGGASLQPRESDSSMSGAGFKVVPGRKKGGKK